MEKFFVGQIIIGRGIQKHNKGIIRKFWVTKVGKKYLYVVQEESGSMPPMTLDKETLEDKDWRGEWEFFVSEKAMAEHDEILRLVSEIRVRVDRSSIFNIGLDKLRQIRALLDEKKG